MRWVFLTFYLLFLQAVSGCAEPQESLIPNNPTDLSKQPTILKSAISDYVMLKSQVSQTAEFNELFPIYAQTQKFMQDLNQKEQEELYYIHSELQEAYSIKVDYLIKKRLDRAQSLSELHMLSKQLYNSGILTQSSAVYLKQIKALYAEYLQKNRKKVISLATSQVTKAKTLNDLRATQYMVERFKSHAQKKSFMKQVLQLEKLYLNTAIQLAKKEFYALKKLKKINYVAEKYQSFEPYRPKFKQSIKAARIQRLQKLGLEEVQYIYHERQLQTLSSTYKKLIPEANYQKQLQVKVRQQEKKITELSPLAQNFMQQKTDIMHQIQRISLIQSAYQQVKRLTYAAERINILQPLIENDSAYQAHFEQLNAAYEKQAKKSLKNLFAPIRTIEGLRSLENDIHTIDLGNPTIQHTKEELTEAKKSALASQHGIQFQRHTLYQKLTFNFERQPVFMNFIKEDAQQKEYILLALDVQQNPDLKNKLIQIHFTSLHHKKQTFSVEVSELISGKFKIIDTTGTVYPVVLSPTPVMEIKAMNLNSLHDAGDVQSITYHAKNKHFTLTQAQLTPLNYPKPTLFPASSKIELKAGSTQFLDLTPVPSSTWQLIALPSELIRHKLLPDLFSLANGHPEQKNHTSASRSQHVEVFINGHYQGLYLLSQSINHDLLNFESVKSVPHDELPQVPSLHYLNEYLLDTHALPSKMQQLYPQSDIAAIEANKQRIELNIKLAKMDSNASLKQLQQEVNLSSIADHFILTYLTDSKDYVKQNIFYASEYNTQLMKNLPRMLIGHSHHAYRGRAHQDSIQYIKTPYGFCQSALTNQLWRFQAFNQLVAQRLQALQDILQPQAISQHIASMQQNIDSPNQGRIKTSAYQRAQQRGQVKKVSLVRHIQSLKQTISSRHHDLKRLLKKQSGQIPQSLYDDDSMYKRCFLHTAAHALNLFIYRPVAYSSLDFTRQHFEEHTPPYKTLIQKPNTDLSQGPVADFGTHSSLQQVIATLDMPDALQTVQNLVPVKSPRIKGTESEPEVELKKIMQNHNALQGQVKKLKNKALEPILETALENLEKKAEHHIQQANVYQKTLHNYRALAPEDPNKLVFIEQLITRITQQKINKQIQAIKNSMIFNPTSSDAKFSYLWTQVNQDHFTEIDAIEIPHILHSAAPLLLPQVSPFLWREQSPLYLHIEQGLKQGLVRHTSLLKNQIKRSQQLTSKIKLMQKFWVEQPKITAKINKIKQSRTSPIRKLKKLKSLEKSISKFRITEKPIHQVSRFTKAFSKVENQYRKEITTQTQLAIKKAKRPAQQKRIEKQIKRIGFQDTTIKKEIKQTILNRSFTPDMPGTQSIKVKEQKDQKLFLKIEYQSKELFHHILTQADQEYILLSLDLSRITDQAEAELEFTFINKDSQVEKLKTSIMDLKSGTVQFSHAITEQIYEFVFSPTAVMDIQAPSMPELGRQGQADNLTYYIRNTSRMLGNAQMKSWDANSLNPSKKNSEIFFKKPYHLTSFSNMKSAKWVLLAETEDPTMLKDQLIKDLFSRAAAIGQNTPAPYAFNASDATHVEVFFNHQYQGLYLLSHVVNDQLLGFETPKSSHKPPVINDILPIIKLSEYLLDLHASRAQIQQYYPNRDITDGVESLRNINHQLSRMSFDTPLSKLNQHIHTPSLADHFILTYVTKAIDNITENVYLVSNYHNQLHRNIVRTMIWDGDHILPRAHTEQNTKAVNDYNYCYSSFTDMLWKFESFRELVRERIQKLKSSKLFLQKRLQRRLMKSREKFAKPNPTSSDMITHAYKRNAQRWTQSREKLTPKINLYARTIAARFKQLQKMTHQKETKKPKSLKLKGKVSFYQMCYRRMIDRALYMVFHGQAPRSADQPYFDFKQRFHFKEPLPLYKVKQLQDGHKSEAFHAFTHFKLDYENIPLYQLNQLEHDTRLDLVQLPVTTQAHRAHQTAKELSLAYIKEANKTTSFSNLKAERQKSLAQFRTANLKDMQEINFCLDIKASLNEGHDKQKAVEKLLQGAVNRRVEIAQAYLKTYEQRDHFAKLDTLEMIGMLEGYAEFLQHDNAPYLWNHNTLLLQQANQSLDQRIHNALNKLLDRALKFNQEVDDWSKIN
tara:strand:- start:1816 stop:8109 length:6294 start_codon:yes stop_codon:yes gene_type:complete